MLSVQEGAQKALRQVAAYKKCYGMYFYLDDKYLRRILTAADGVKNGRPWTGICCKSIDYCTRFYTCSQCWRDLMEIDKNDD